VDVDGDGIMEIAGDDVTGEVFAFTFDFYDAATGFTSLDGDSIAFWGGADSTDGIYEVSDLGAAAGVSFSVGTGKLASSEVGVLHQVVIHVEDDDAAGPADQTHDFKCWQLFQTVGVFKHTDNSKVNGPAAFSWDFSTTNPGGSTGSGNGVGTEQWGLVIQWLAPRAAADMTLTIGQFLPPTLGYLDGMYAYDADIDFHMDFRVDNDEGGNPAVKVDPAAWTGDWPFDQIGHTDGVPLDWDVDQVGPVSGTYDQTDVTTITISIDDMDGYAWNQFELIWITYNLGDDGTLLDDNTALPAVLPDAEWTASVAIGGAVDS
jgi:hypothetical protein